MAKQESKESLHMHLDSGPFTCAQLCCLDYIILASSAIARSLAKLVYDGSLRHGLHPTEVKGIEGSIQKLFDEGICHLLIVV